MSPERPGWAPINAGVPITQYAQIGELSIAYQVLGSGPLDIVHIPSWITNVEENWNEPGYAHFLHRLASFSRLILFDKRGTGLSDRVAGMPSLEQRIKDVLAVMTAVGSQQAVLFGSTEGSAMSALFAATYPERTRALVMYGAYAKRMKSVDYPWGPSDEERQAFLDGLMSDWGGPAGLDMLARDAQHDRRFREWWSGYLRRSSSPGAALALTRMNSEIDIRHVLPTIRVPTLVLHRREDPLCPVEGGRYIAAHIAGCAVCGGCRARSPALRGRYRFAAGSGGRVPDRRPARGGDGPGAHHDPRHRYSEFHGAGGGAGRWTLACPAGIVPDDGARTVRAFPWRRAQCDGRWFVATFDGAGQGDSLRVGDRAPGAGDRAGDSGGIAHRGVHALWRPAGWDRRACGGPGDRLRRAVGNCSIEHGAGPGGGIEHPLRAPWAAYAEGDSRVVATVSRWISRGNTRGTMSPPDRDGYRSRYR